MWKLAQIITLVLFPTYSLAAEHTPREAGARYAQALGAAEVCPGVRASKMVEALKHEFHGEALYQFNAQAATVYGEWLKVKNCMAPHDPNPCRIVVQLSCKAAISEIGPNGSAYPDLLQTGQ
ncbi:MAG: hypothetical protein R3D51_07235 [Hyphomicrobiaceae bacterium]